MSILDKLPSIVKAVISEIDVKPVDNSDTKPFIIACSRDITPTELELLKSYGRVLVFDNSFINIPLSSHQFNYSIFDLHNKIHRDALAKEDLSNYHVVCVVGMLDTHDDFSDDIHAENCIRSFPARQAFLTDFNRLLLSKKIRKPSFLKSALRFLCFLQSGFPKE